MMLSVFQKKKNLITTSIKGVDPKMSLLCTNIFERILSIGLIYDKNVMFIQ